MPEEYIVDPDLAGRLRELNPLEHEQLEQNLIRDGMVLDPIIVWDKYILDGRTRYPIAKARGLSYSIKELNLGSRDEAKLWVIDHQLGKRNLSNFEQSQLRAERARIEGDTAAVADKHGVSRRTVQRDVEILSAKEGMSADVRARCESGSVINHGLDWRKYGALTPEQRLVVDQKLRDSTNLTLRQALPRTGDDISLENIEAINDCKFLTTAQKQGISTERIHSDNDSVSAYLKLPDTKKTLIREILDDPEIDDLGDAIRTLSGGAAPRGPSAQSATINAKIEKRIEQLLGLFDELGEEYRDSSSSLKEDCITATRHLQATWIRWAERNSGK